ncbi:MAG TPA: hypothetical protein VMS60_15405 [Solirubrobacterales bacterium]|nr:hypothetical protein [Solirubrobacterales bacterium]
MNSEITNSTPLALRRGLKLIAMLAATCALLAVAAASASALSIERAEVEMTEENGDPTTQAGKHPFQLTTEIEFDTIIGGGGEPLPNGNFKDISAQLPAGLIGNQNAIDKCSITEFQDRANFFEEGKCKAETAVGVASVLESTGSEKFAPVFNLQPNPGEPALLAFHIITASVFLHPNARTGGDYGITVDLPNLSQVLPLSGTSLTFWGVPADDSHDAERGTCMTGLGPSGALCPSADAADPTPFLTTPTSCEGPLRTELKANSWQEPEVFDTATILNHDADGNPVNPSGCEELEFEPTFDAAVSPANADSPAALSVDIEVPQNNDPEDLATAHLKKAVVTLPAGTTVNSAAANGLGTCSEEQFGSNNANPVACPESSRIGEVEILSELSVSPLRGGVFLAEQSKNPFGSLLAVYLEAEAEGALIKLPGKIETDAQTGQVTATFDNNPQLPFTDVAVDLFGGNSGVLTLPTSCGTYNTTATLTPWSGTAPVTQSSSFTVNTGPGGAACPNNGFGPKFSAGSVVPRGGQYSPFVVNLSREDGTQRLTGVDVSLPNGLLANLTGIPYCGDAVIAGIPTGVGTGAAQAASPSCPAASQVGTASVQTGTGPSPFFVNTGKVYLAGPYKGAPLSLAVVAPALAGPFDVGNVVVRAALRVNPETAQVEAISDPIPTILAGIPLNLRDLRISVDRPRFAINPTNCAATAVRGTISGSGGAAVPVTDRFQVGGCASLGFKPKLALRLKGGTKRNKYPALTATVGYRPGDANLARVSVTLPHSEFLAQNHIRTICTRAQFAAGPVPGAACPAGSVYGFASVTTPLLGAPLSGPVYLRSSSHKLPDLVMALHGQIDIVVAGRIDSFKKGIRTTFESVPDAPLASFTLALKGGKKSLLVNSRDLCASTNRAVVQITGQNGATVKSKPAVANGCKKKKK